MGNGVDDDALCLGTCLVCSDKGWDVGKAMGVWSSLSLRSDSHSDARCRLFTEVCDDTWSVSHRRHDFSLRGYVDRPLLEVPDGCIRTREHEKAIGILERASFAMIELAGHDRCCGCAACCTVCPKGALAMQPDEEGFLRPVIDAMKCVQCGRCHAVCPVLHPIAPRLMSAQVYAARAKDRTLRLESSSGGIFSLLARQVLHQGGLVFGAACDLKTGRVGHIAVEDEAGLARLRGSKYVQSDMGTVYRQVREALAYGREVLFSGTPCQISALRRVVGKDDDRLLCVDVICHAAPSPLAWQKYLEKRVDEQSRGRDSAWTGGSKFRRLSFRRKNCGWKRYSLSLRFANDKEYLCDLKTDPFLRGFLSELYNRRSCHQCTVREGRSGSDVTLADYWRVWERFPELDDDTGTSLVLVHTKKGAAAFAALETEIESRRSDIDDAIRTNPALVRSSPAHPKRERFFALLRSGVDFDVVVMRLLKRPLWRRCGSLVKRVFRKLLGR